MRIVVAVLALAALLSDTASAVEQLDRVVEQREQLEQEVARAAEAYEDLMARLATAEEDLATLGTRVAALEEESVKTADALTMRARTAFKHGDGSMITTLLTSDGPAGALERAQLLSAITSRDRGRLEGAQNLRIQLEQARALMADKGVELDAIRAQMEQRSAELASRLRTTRAVESELRDRYERQLIIERGLQNGTYACIIQAPYHFRDTWGAPRSGGRRHKGTDVFGRWNAQVYAFTNGRIQRVSRSRLGGIGLYLYGDDGVEYFYAHINGLAESAYVGKRVEAGEWIAYNGDTGNARGGAPHVHFQVHPGGGAPVNPYPWLAPACF